MRKCALLMLAAFACLAKMQPTDYPGDGKPIIVRLYTPDRGDSQSFEQFNTAIQSNGFVLDIADAPKGSVVAVVPTDQADPTVVKFLGNEVQTWRYPGSGPYLLRNGGPGRSVSVADALGSLIRDAVVQIRLRGGASKDLCEIQLGPWQTGQDGRAELPQFRGDLDAAEATVAAKDYGTALVRLFGNADTLKTGLVARGTPAWERALRGVVLDPHGGPIGNAAVMVEHVRTPGEGLIQNEAVKVVTDPQGRFAVYMPVGRSYHSPVGEGALVPPHSRYAYRVEAPGALGLPPRVGEAYNDEETVIKFEAGSFHTFAFENADGPITDPKQLEYVTVIGKDYRYRIDADALRTGTVLAYGTYRATMQIVDPGGGMGDTVNFTPIEVTASSPAELVFRLPKHGITLTGQIVHAMTKSPLAGIFVIVGGGRGYGEYVEDLTSDDWRLLESLPANPGPADLADKQLRKLIPCDTIARSDKAGRFRIALRPGSEASSVGLWARDFLPYLYRAEHSTPNAEGVLELGNIPMFPAGMVTLLVTSDREQDQYVPNWRVDEFAPPEWARPVLTCLPQQNHWSVFDNNWRPVNTPQKRYVPAGLSLTMEIVCANPRTYDFTMSKSFRVAQGQHIDLGAVALQPAVEVSVQVTDEAGQPYEGAPVTVKVDECWQVPQNTDANGMAKFRIAPNAVGVFGILATTHEEGVDPIVASTPFSLSGGVPSEAVYVIVLPRKDMNRVFTE